MTAASIPRPSLVGVWLAAIRPATLTAAVGPVAVGSAFAYRDGAFNAVAAIAALMGAVFIQIGTNLYNDHADFVKGADTESRLGPARAVQRGWLTSGQVLTGAAVNLAAATICGVYLVAIAGWPILVLGLASLACAVLYTGGPYPLAYVGLGDVFVMAFFGGGAVCGTYFVQRHTVSAEAIIASISVGALATAILVVNNLRDRTTDQEANKNTLVVRFGQRFGQMEYVGLLALAYAGLTVLMFRSDHFNIVWLLPMATLPIATATTRRVLGNEGASLNPLLGATARLGLLFSLALAAAAVMS